MSKNTSIALNQHFEKFIKKKVSSGRYSSASDVIRAALRLLENEENKIEYLRSALDEGEKSKIDDNFNPDDHLRELRSKHI